MIIKESKNNTIFMTKLWIYFQYKNTAQKIWEKICILSQKIDIKFLYDYVVSVK